MKRRMERIASQVRERIGQVVLAKIADPRVDPARTSVTRVEVAEDTQTAKVYVSIMGSDADERKAVEALQHAAGRIQEIVFRGVRLRHTPRLQFLVDEEFKRTQQTLDLIQQAMAEIREKEQQEQSADDTDTVGPAEEGSARDEERDGV